MAIYAKDNIEFFHRSKRNKPYRMPVAHFHNKYELYFLVKGKTKYFIENEIFLLSPYDMIFVPKGVFHKTDSEENYDVERVLFSFDDEFIGDDISEYINELSSNKYIRFSGENVYKIEDIIRKIEKENTKKEKGYNDMQKLYFKQLIISISRYRIKENNTRLNGSYLAIQDIVKYISKNYNQDLSLNSLSKKYSISPNHLSKQFKNVTGVGLNEYINISRITAAEKLLVSTNKPITLVATECGFNDSNYFAAVFKKLKGITPKKYSSINKLGV